MYYDSLVSAIPVYKTNKRYGSLICAYPPLNCVALVLTPIFFIFDKNSKIISTLNKIFCILCYVPIAIIISAIFIAFSLLSLPFAYFAALLTKYRIITSRLRTSQDSEIALKFDFIQFTLFGLIILSLTLFQDIYYFIRNLFLLEYNKPAAFEM